jgi:hypothetical protein
MGLVARLNRRELIVVAEAGIVLLHGLGSAVGGWDRVARRGGFKKRGLGSVGTHGEALDRGHGGEGGEEGEEEDGGEEKKRGGRGRGHGFRR